MVKFLQIHLPFSKETEQINAVSQFVEALRYLKDLLDMVKFLQIHYLFRRKLNKSTPYRSLLRHCVTSRKVAGSIPDVMEIFH